MSAKSKSRRKSAKNGRPSAPIDPAELDKLCAMQATDEEIAAWFRVNRKTISRRKQDLKSRLKVVTVIVDRKATKDTAAQTHEDVFRGTFAEVMERGKARGRISIRRSLFTLALGGNVAAAIFLSKNLLGYRDIVEVAPPEEEAPPTDIVWDLPTSENAGA